MYKVAHQVFYCTVAAEQYQAMLARTTGKLYPLERI
jgi:hypothetical protein